LVPLVEKIIVVQASCNVPQVLKLLVDNNIYSAPVLSDGSLLGGIHLLDVVTFVVTVFEETKSAISLDYGKLLQDRVALFQTPHANTIVDIASRNHCLPVPAAISFGELLHTITNTKAHQVLLSDEQKNIVNLVTETTLLRVIAQNKQSLGPVLKKSLVELGLANKPVFSIGLKEPAVNALKIMAQHRITGVAVTEEDGRLFSNISAKDLKCVARSEELFLALQKETALQFIQRSRKLKAEYTFAASISVMPNDSLEHLIIKFDATKIHRIFVVDEHSHPLGVVSIGDVLALIASLL